MISKLLSRSMVPVALVAGLVFGAAGIAASEGMAPHGHMHRCGMRRGGNMGLRLMLKSANLTDAQKAQVHQIFSSRRTTIGPQIQQLKAAKLAMAEKFMAPGTLAASDVSDQVNTITQIKNQIAQERLQDAIAVRNLLTPAQLQNVAQTKSKLDKIHSEMKSLWGRQGSASTTTTTTPTE